jgi:hypothetical protein
VTELPPGPGRAVEDRLTEIWLVDPDPDAVVRARTSTLVAFAGRSRRRRVRVPITIAACVLISGVTGAWAAAAAATSLPGDTAYGLKRAVEQVQLTVATSDEAEVEVLLRLADRRVGEAVRAEAAGRLDAVEEAVYGYGDVMEDLAAREPALPEPALRARADRARQVHREVLGALVNSLPPPARAAIQQRLSDSAGPAWETEPGRPAGVPTPPVRPGGPPPGPGDAGDADQADRSGDPEDGRLRGFPPEDVGPPDGVGPPGARAPDPPVPDSSPRPSSGLPAPAQRGISDARPSLPSSARTESVQGHP